MAAMTRSTSRLFKRNDDTLPTSPQSVLFGRRRRSQTEGAERGNGLEDRPWARFTAKVTARLTSLSPTAVAQEHPRRSQTPTADMMTPRRQPIDPEALEAKPLPPQPFVLPYNHPFLKESSRPPSMTSHHRNSLLPPPRGSSTRRMSMQSARSDLTHHLSLLDTPPTQHPPSFGRSTSPTPTGKFTPTAPPTPPLSAKHTTKFPGEPIQRPWSGHPFSAATPSGDGTSQGEFFSPDFGELFAISEQPQGLEAHLSQLVPTPEPSPLRPPAPLPIVADPGSPGSATSRPRRGTFGSSDQPTFDDRERGVAETDPERRHGYHGDDQMRANAYAYARERERYREPHHDYHRDREYGRWR